MIEPVATWIADTLGAEVDLVRKLVGTLAVVAGYVVARRLVLRFLGRRFEDGTTRYRFNKATQLVFLVVAFALLFRVWFQGASGIGTWLGLASAGLAFALREPLEGLAGWVYFVTRRPFRVGDRIQIGEHAGDVVDVHLFSFTLAEIGKWVDADQSTGRLLHVPNGWMFKHPIAHYDGGSPYIWNEIAVSITYESDWRAAKRALEAILDEHAEKVDGDDGDRGTEMLGVDFTRMTPGVWVSNVPEGIRLSMRYACRPRVRRVSTSHMWEAILDAFAALSGVAFAYPTQRFFEHAIEGKPALRGAADPGTSTTERAGAPPVR